MVEFIEEIITKFGGRIAGSKEEREAQKIVQARLNVFSSNTEWHEFEDTLTAKFKSLKWLCTGLWIGLLVFPWSVLAALLISIVTSVLFVAQFLFNLGWLDRFYPKQKSVNVTGTILPEQKSKLTILVSGHIDSVWEFQWWYHLKRFGGTLTSIAGMLFILQPFLFLVIGLIQLTNGCQTWMFWIWIAFVVLSPSLLVFFFIHGKTKVDGALDNLSGVAIALSVGEYFSKNKLNHITIKPVSFGSEETGVKGSQNYVKDHINELQFENTLIINVDTIRSDEHIYILKKETTSFLNYPKPLIDEMKTSFEAIGLEPKSSALPIGGTDAAPFAKKNIDAISIVGLDTSKLDPTYHTRLDNLSNLNPIGIEKLRKAIIYFIEERDQQLNS